MVLPTNAVPLRPSSSRAAWVHLGDRLGDIVGEKSRDVSEPLLVEAIARAFNPRANSTELETLVVAAHSVVDTLLNCTFSESDLLSGYARPWFPAIESVLKLPEGYCATILANFDTSNSNLMYPPDMWEGMTMMSEAPTEEPAPETPDSAFETLDDKNHNPGLTLATQDLAALTGTSDDYLNASLFASSTDVHPLPEPTERERLAERIASLSASFVEILTNLEHLRIEGIRPGALAAAKSATASAFAEALKATAGIENGK